MPTWQMVFTVGTLETYVTTKNNNNDATSTSE